MGLLNICFPLLNTNIVTAKDIEKQINDILVRERLIYLREESNEGYLDPETGSISGNNEGLDQGEFVFYNLDKNAILTYNNIGKFERIVNINQDLFVSYDHDWFHGTRPSVLSHPIKNHYNERVYIFKLKYIPLNADFSDTFAANSAKQGDSLPIKRINNATYYFPGDDYDLIDYYTTIPESVYNKIKPLMNQIQSLVSNI